MGRQVVLTDRQETVCILNVLLVLVKININKSTSRLTNKCHQEGIQLKLKLVGVLKTSLFNRLKWKKEEKKSSLDLTSQIIFKFKINLLVIILSKEAIICFTLLNFDLE